jgi:hypothetical protein
VLHGGEVGLLGIMHVEADLLDGVDDVGAGERQVLEGPLEVSRIRTGGSDLTETLACVSTSVKTGLQSTMPARSRISRAN